MALTEDAGMTASDWDDCYREGHLSWDLGGPHPLLEERLTNDPTLGLGRLGSVLVPGCGRGWDAAALVQAGWNVVAVDFSVEAVAHAGDVLTGPKCRVSAGDAFAEQGSYDLVFDHTFFCAVPPVDRSRFGELCRRVIVPGGSLISIVFPIRPLSIASGPPWPIAADDIDEALGPGFLRIETAPEFRMPGRRWPHRWVRWDRTVAQESYE